MLHRIREKQVHSRVVTVDYDDTNMMLYAHYYKLIRDDDLMSRIKNKIEVNGVLVHVFRSPHSCMGQTYDEVLENSRGNMVRLTEHRSFYSRGKLEELLKWMNTPVHKITGVKRSRKAKGEVR